MHFGIKSLTNRLHGCSKKNKKKHFTNACGQTAGAEPSESLCNVLWGTLRLGNNSATRFWKTPKIAAAAAAVISAEQQMLLL